MKPIQTVNYLKQSTLVFMYTKRNYKQTMYIKCVIIDLLSIESVHNFYLHFAWGYSSVVEHSTADREVLGSNPSVP